MLTREKVILIQRDLKDAMEVIAAKHGLAAGAVKANFTSSDVKITTGFSDKESTGGVEIDPTYIRNLLRNGSTHGIFAKAGTPFTLGGMAYILHGMRGAYVVAQRQSDKKLFRYDAQLIATCLASAGLNKPT